MPKLDEILQRLPGREGWRRVDEPTKEIKPFTNSITQKTTNEPTGRYFVTIAGPNGVTQRLILGEGEGADDWTLEGLDAVHALPKDTSASSGAVTGSQYGTWEPDPANPGQYRQVVPPQAGISDPNEARSKAIKAQTDEADRDRRIANERATGMYVDDKELATIRHAEATDEVAAARLKEDIRNNTARQKAEDDKLHLENQKFLQVELPKSTADIARLGAETGKIGAETDLTKAQIVALGIKTESDTARALAAGLLDKAQADKINFELKKPADVTGGPEQQFLLRRTPEGQLIQDLNPNYQGPKAPTTRGELAQRVSTLQTQAQQMRDRIAADKSIPPDQQAARFNQWYDQNVAPQAGALEQQQQAIARDEAQKAMTAAATAISTTAPYRVGPNFASSFEQGLNRLANVHGGGKTPLDFTGSVGWKGPSIDQAVQQTLAPAPGMDFQNLLNRNQWAPGGGPAPAMGAPAGPVAAGPTPSPPTSMPFGAIGANPMLAAMQARGGVPDPNAALRARQAADAALQARQAQVGQPVPQQPPALPLPSATPMPLATGSGPLPYSTSTWRPPVLPAPPAPTTGAPGQPYGLVADAANPYATMPPAPTTGVPGQPYGLVADAANPFASVIPYLSGYDPTQIQTQWDWPHLTPG